jgi:aspartyl-tRNA(Asn)/glutamyl-tRNA(Gln) amidotransferase subunit A
MIAFASSLDQCGTLTRDVTDAAILLDALCKHDPCDSTSLGIEGGVARPARTDLRGLRFGVAPDFSADAEGVEAGVAATFARNLDLIRDLGGEIVEISLPHAQHGLSAYYVIAPAECSANLARFDGVRYGLRAGDAADLTSMYEATREAGFGAEVKRRIMLGTYALSAGYYDAYYGRALRVRTKISSDFEQAFADVDYVVTPTSPCVAFEQGAKAADPMAMYLSDYFTVPMPLAGIPAVSIPSGLAPPASGGPELPVGLQLAGPAFSEPGILDAAYALEQALEFKALEVTA